jgi:hypothetical protein
VGSDHGAVKNEPLQVGLLQPLEGSEPGSLVGPPIEPSPHRIPVPEAFGEITPRGPGLGDPEDSVDEETVIGGGYSGVVILARKEALDAFPVVIRDLVATHGWVLGG